MYNRTVTGHIWISLVKYFLTFITYNMVKKENLRLFLKTNGNILKTGENESMMHFIIIIMHFFFKQILSYK